jgi:Zn-dependent protease with chaperone function
MPQSYETLVARLTEYARRHPRGYRARVAGLALLGYAYLFAALVLLAAVVAGMTWSILHNVGAWLVLKLSIPVIILISVIVRSLWVRFSPPGGTDLSPDDAPALMAEIERVRTAMQAPRVYRVVMTDDFNAAVSHYPRWGVLGGYRVYLVLGLPMMAALPVEEFRAVLAHEFGHVSRAHGRLGAWTLRVSQTWLRLLEELDRKNHWGQALFTRFFRWYAPYYEAYTTVLRRQQEFEADEMAAAISRGGVGPSLCRMEVASRWLEREFWAEVSAGTRDSAEPPADVHRRLRGGIRTAHAHPKAAEWLEEGLAQPTRLTDSHPAVRERLAAVGAAPGAVSDFEISAAQALLGPHADTLTDEMSRGWQEAVREDWMQRHERAVEIAAKLAELEARAEPLNAEERGERLWMTAELHGDRVAVPLARAYLDAEQEDAAVHFLLGRALAEENDEAALPHLERAMALDEQFTPPGCEVAAGMLMRRGRDRDAEPFRARWAAYHQRMAAARHERSLRALTPGDRFIPHGLNAEQLAEVRRQVAVPGVKRAYVLRKRMVHFPDDPCYVIGVVPGGAGAAHPAGDAHRHHPGQQPQEVPPRVPRRARRRDLPRAVAPAPRPEPADRVSAGSAAFRIAGGAAAAAVRSALFFAAAYLSPLLLLALTYVAMPVPRLSGFFYESIFRVTPLWCEGVKTSMCWTVQGLARYWAYGVWGAAALAFGFWTRNHPLRALPLPALLVFIGVMLTMALVMRISGVALFVDTM